MGVGVCAWCGVGVGGCESGWVCVWWHRYVTQFISIIDAIVYLMTSEISNTLTREDIP